MTTPPSGAASRCTSRCGRGGGGRDGRAGAMSNSSGCCWPRCCERGRDSGWMHSLAGRLQRSCVQRGAWGKGLQWCWRQRPRAGSSRAGRPRQQRAGAGPAGLRVLSAAACACCRWSRRACAGVCCVPQHGVPALPRPRGRLLHGGGGQGHGSRHGGARGTQALQQQRPGWRSSRSTKQQTQQPACSALTRCAPGLAPPVPALSLPPPPRWWTAPTTRARCLSGPGA